MRICLASPYGLHRVSGITTFLVTLVSGLLERGHSILVLSPSPRPETIPPQVAVLVAPRNDTFANVRLAAWTIQVLWRHREDWDLVHCQQGHLQSFLALFLARILGRPAVTTFHLRPPQRRGLRGVLEALWIRASFLMSSHPVFVSEHTRATIGGRGVVIPNGVDVASVEKALGDQHALRTELGLEGFVVGFMGRRARNKGYQDLLKALARARASGVDVRMLTTGDVPMDEIADVDRCIRDLSLGPFVWDLGDREDHLRFLSAIDVFALPSYQEGMPLAVLEAMAAGVPILVSNVGGLPEIITDGREGFLIAPGDIEALVSRIALLAGNPTLRATIALSAKHSSSTFDVVRTVSKYVSLYERALVPLPGS